MRLIFPHFFQITGDFDAHLRTIHLTMNKIKRLYVSFLFGQNTNHFAIYFRKTESLINIMPIFAGHFHITPIVYELSDNPRRI